MADSTGRAAAAAAFLAFAFAYFLAAVLRAVTATLAPTFSAEFGLGSGDLGLLAGAFFLGFALLQLPLGAALDRYGPRRVVLSLLVLAIAGCLAFAAARGLGGLLAARALTGMGVAACLMGPLTHFRRHFSPEAQLRANSWMLMSGSLGMVASTLPVQWVLASWGWRGLFVGVALTLALAALMLAVVVRPGSVPAASGASPVGPAPGYRQVWAHPDFRRVAPLGFFVYGGMIAMQSLWAGPWLTRVAGQSAGQAAQGLFTINLCMLAAFMTWGLVMPGLARRGWTASALVARGVPLSLAMLLAIVASPWPANAPVWAAWCVSCTVVSLTQPALGQSFPPELAGRALSAYNLVIFSGVFSIQWGIGLIVDAARGQGLGDAAAFRLALALFATCSALAYGAFRRRWADVPDGAGPRGR